MRNFMWAMSIVAGIGCFPSTMVGMNLTLINSEGAPIEVAINSSDKFSDIMTSLAGYFGENGTASMTMLVANEEVMIRKKTHYRDYWTPVTKAEKKELYYIVKTLARDSLPSIGLSNSSLNKAGDKIVHLHPLNFLKTIFEDEEMKAYAHAIRDRGGLIWSGFMGGVSKSSDQETARNNIKEEFIEDFAMILKIDVNLIIPPIQKSNWKDLVNVLIDKIPRANDPNRYDM